MDKHAKKRYDTFIVKFSLLLEHGVYLDDVVGSVDCPEMLRAQKWDPLFDVHMEDKIYVDLIKVFYANIHEYKENELTFKSLVRKKSITISPDFISNILKIDRPDIHENFIVFPYSSKEQYLEMATVILGICIGSVPRENEKSKIAHIDLTPTFRMLNCIVACDIHPRGHTAEIVYDITQLLYVIGERGVYIDLPLYIFNHVLKASKHDSFMYPMNAMGMGTLNKNVGVILGAKQDKRVKQPSAVSNCG
ncbi:unnamed protein product [Ilex paraguariensis]|uniref:Putative plant transposon protein domain-containing protein n=1 Tax=Ilex paraguariensis TaxID=185542 RepID=A0ABC8UC49_9AQUA